jgi:hypothetical protein
LGAERVHEAIDASPWILFRGDDGAFLWRHSILLLKRKRRKPADESTFCRFFHIT